MMTSTLITLICIIVILFGGTVLVMLKAMNQKNFGDEDELEVAAEAVDATAAPAEKAADAVETAETEDK